MKTRRQKSTRKLAAQPKIVILERLSKRTILHMQTQKVFLHIILSSMNFHLHQLIVGVS